MKLRAKEVQTLLEDYPGWIYQKETLQKTFKFTDFLKALLFLNQITNPIEEWHSYPRIEINYNQVLLTLHNPHHGVLTEREQKLLQDIEIIFENNYSVQNKI